MSTIKKTVHVVAAVIENEAGEILSVLRSPNMTLPNYWEFPGGKIEAGETRAEALKREIREELKCAIQVFEQVEDTTYEYDTFIVRLETFMSKISEGSPQLTEHAAMKWVPRQDLHQLNWAPADIPAIEKLIALSETTELQSLGTSIESKDKSF